MANAPSIFPSFNQIIVYFCRPNKISNTLNTNRTYRLLVTLLLAAATLFSCGKKAQNTPSRPTTTGTHSQASISTKASPLPAGFCYVKDSIPDVIQDIRYYSDYNFVGMRIDGYEAPVAILTTAAASALRKIADEMRSKGYLLKIYDAYRPQMAVDHFVRWAQKPTDTLMKAVFYPDIPKSTIFSRGFVATKSSHTRGSTVDLTIVHARTGKDVDMGSPFDFFGDISHTDYEGITKEQHDNRMLLKNTMVKHGFQPIRGEWWHFTLRNEPYPETYFDFKVKDER